MTILNWVAGFQLRTGWQFLSSEESAELSESMRAPAGIRLRAIAQHRQGDRLACLDAAGPDPRRARVFILHRVDARRAHVEEEHSSLAAWVRALGLTSDHEASGAHDRG